jgi:hypothetical protein
MPVSEARLLANKQNALRSTGPKTAEGKERSRRNALKHGLAGSGIVLIDEDIAEVERRHDELQAELAPSSSLGKILVRDLATQSVRMERAGREESAAIAERVRHAVDAFDQDQHDRAGTLMLGLAEDPRGNLRKLRRTPEGVEALLDAWDELRDALANGGWADRHQNRLENLGGRRAETWRCSPLGALAKAAGGDFSALGTLEGSHLDRDHRTAWAKGELLDKIDAEIAALEAHYESLDHDAFEQDRIEAPARALFDPSREACLARRYEAESRRGFYRALRELRKAEAEAAARPKPPEVSPPLGSFREKPAPPPRDPRPTAPESRMVADEVGLGHQNRPEMASRAEILSRAGLQAAGV